MNREVKFVLVAFTVMAFLAVPAFAGVEPDVRVPEPATLALLATGLGVVGVFRKFRKK